MKNDEPMKMGEALRATRELLQGISVPVGLISQIGVPIIAAIENLQNLEEALKQGEAKAAPDSGGSEETAIREEDL